MRPFRPALLAVSVAALAACSDQGPVATAPVSAGPAPLLAASGRAIEGSYVVVLKPGADPRSVAAAAGVSPRFVYAAALSGFAAELNQGQLAALRHNPAVEYVEPDQVMTAATTQSGATWGIDRIDQRNLPLSGTYTYTATASSVRAYVLDTGLQPGHPEFEGRAQSVYNAISGETADDCNGHGTHVAGTVGSKTYGVAKKAQLRGVKVLNCSGSGSTSGIIAGVDWVRANAQKPAVANLSLGGAYSASLNTAVDNLASSGVFVAVAAGNSNADACNYSPASAASAYTTAASNSDDTRRSTSNYGSCVDGFAPGGSITSTWLNGGTSTISGTSMASPHVAGVAALYKATYGDAASSTIDTWIKNNSTTGVVKNVPSGTPNRLLYKAGL
ncbi:MAG TPA: S8 family peptidase [Longimicrobiaceae bacterium]|nr:S8 family peptidase [Longimicrobiaceae bacterium]